MGTVLFAGASETATLTVTFNVTSGGVTTPTDPTTITLTVKDPLGASSTYTYPSTVTKTSTGNFWANVSTPTAGEWAYTWTGTGTVPDVQHGSFTVQETELGHLYCTPQALKSRVGIGTASTSDDLELQGACYAASRHVENTCQRRFWRNATSAPETRVLDVGLSLYTVHLGPWNDLLSVATLATDVDGDGVFETTWAGTAYALEPANTAGGPEARPYSRIRAVSTNLLPSTTTSTGRLGRIQVAGVWGWPAVPSPVAEATRILAAALFKAKDAPFGVASFGEYGAVRVRQDPMVEMLLAPYMHLPGVA